MKILAVFIALLSPLALADIGTIVMLKGTASMKNEASKITEWSSIAENYKLQSGDKIKTGKASFVKAQMIDQTIISIGANSEFHFSKFKVQDGKRFNIYGVLTGKVRAIINKRASEGEKIQFNSEVVSMGVRGTEFISSVYQKAGETVSDVYLLKGKLEVDPSKLGNGMKKFALNAGESFNTTDLLKNGMKAIRKIKPEALQKLLDNKTSFGSSLSLSTPAVSATQAGLAVGAGLATVGSGLTPAVTSKDEQKPEKVVPKKKKTAKIKKKNTKVQGLIDFKYILKSEPRDIREALLNRKRDLKKNKCFYWYYKTLPGGGDPERFRRERDCDEFDYDL